MADGYHQFQQGNAQRYYLQRLGGRASPARIQQDTPSPSHSPAPQSPGNNLNYYSQNHQGIQMMHGTTGAPAHSRFAMPNAGIKYPPQQHHQQLDHGMGHVQVGNQNNGVNHQHGFSSGVVHSASFTPQHGVNGATAVQATSAHWQEQLALAQASRQAGSPHHHARSAAAMTRGAVPGTSTNIPQPAEQVGNRGFRNGTIPQDKAQFRDHRGEIVRQDWNAIDFGGQGLRALAPPIFHYTFLDKLYINNNKISKLPAAIGRLKRLTYLDASGNVLMDLPPEIGMLTNLKTLLLFDNKLTTLPFEMGTLHQLETLGIEGNPLQEDYKSIMVDSGTRALIVHLRENTPAPEPPLARDWIVLDESRSAEAREQDPNRLQVLCYNILCDKYATQTMYGYTPSWCLDWNYRKSMILEELQERNTDIICIQEVDQDNFEEFFSTELAYKNYKGVFWPKGRAKTMTESERRTVDGCATFYKADKFNLVERRVIDFSSLAIAREDMKATADIYNRVMPKDNIAVVTFLENKITGARMIVANVHIFWDPAFKDVKLVQVAMMMEDLTKCADEWAAKSPKAPSADPNTPTVTYANGSQIPLIVCGDFNSEATSGVYELLSRGSLNYDHDDLEGKTYGKFTKEGMSHPFSLRSSYSNIGELKFTNYTPGFQGVIDYIWYSTNSMEVTGLLGDVDKEYMERVAGFPNHHFPSDHISLVSEFRIKPQKNLTKQPPPDFGPSSNSRK